MTHRVDTKRVLARNTAWNYSGFAINLITNLVMFPYVVHQLGDAAAGVWLLLGSVTGYMGLLELGIVPSLTQMVASSLARGERDGVSRGASSAQALLVGMGCLCLALLPGGPTIVHFLRLPPGMESQALTALRVAIIGFALRMPLATYQAILLGHQRQDRCNQLWIVMGFVKFLAAAAVLSRGYGLVGLVSSEMVIHLAAGILQVKWVSMEAPQLKLSVGFVNRHDVFHLLSFGGALLAVSICSLIIEQTDRLVIATFLPIAMVTHYAAAWKLFAMAYMVTTTLVQAVSPLAADLYGRKDFDGLKQLFLSSTKYTVALAWPIVMALAFAGGFFLRVWMGHAFVDALPLVQVLLLGFLVTAHNHAGYCALSGTRRVGPTVTRYFAPQALLNLLLSIWLVQRIGNLGVALGTMLPAVALEYFFLTFVLRELRVGWKEFLSQTVWGTAAPALLSFWPLVGAYAILDVTSPMLPITAAGCSILYAWVFWKFLSADERHDLISHVPTSIRERARSIALSSNPSLRAEQEP
jgi:O-antigen/teichoic acid export membrane protein